MSKANHLRITRNITRYREYRFPARQTFASKMRGLLGWVWCRL